MSGLTFMLAWCVLQVTLLSLVTTLVYLVVARRGPAVGSAVLLAGLTGILLTSVLSSSPWPRWHTVEFEGPERPAETGLDRPITAARAGTTRRAGIAAAEIPPATGEATATTGGPGDARAIAALIHTFRAGFRPAPPDVPRAPPWLTVVLGVGGMLCVGRWLVGLWIVGRHRRAGRPIRGAALHAELSTIRAEMGCWRAIEPRESGLVSSPAVVGWRQPLLLLPLDWRMWSDDERRAVLAHEVAHVCRNDYPAWLVAQLGLALHFYHPLVHWMVRRLRLEQELAADEWGAQVAGGCTTYLRALAQLALRRDTQPVIWAARPFFSGRDTFVRRIEMLHHRHHQPCRANPWRTRLAAVAAVLAAAVWVAGLRGPASTSALAQTGGAAASERYSLKFVPAQPAMTVAIRVAELLAEPSTGAFLKIWCRDEDVGFRLADLEEVTMVMDPIGEPALSVYRGRGVAPAMLAAIKKAWPAHGTKTETRRCGGTDYTYRPNNGTHGSAWFAVNEDTFVHGSEPLVRDAITAVEAGFKDVPAPSWATEWNAQPDGQIRFAVNTEGIKTAMLTAGFDPVAGFRDRGNRTEDELRVEPLVLAVSPLLAHTKSVIGSGRVTGGLQLSAVAETDSGTAAKTVAETVTACKTLLGNLIHTRRLTDAPAGVPQLLQLTDELLTSATIKADGENVVLSAASRTVVSGVADVYVPIFEQARTGGRKFASSANLRTLARWMMMYHDEHQSFPPAVILGPDGATPHSWRVALLKYGQPDLYRQYRFDQPWDSPDNRRVLEQMPEVYHCPGAPRTTNAAYFVLTGPDTLFPGTAGLSLEKCTDNWSKTLLVVEARRDIPWTKPEDIGYAAGQPLPTLGGFFPGGFHALFADAHTQFVTEAGGDEAGRDIPLSPGLITPAGGD